MREWDIEISATFYVLVHEARGIFVLRERGDLKNDSVSAES